MIRLIKEFIENSKDYIKEWGACDYIIMMLYNLLPTIIVIIITIAVIIWINR